jgi:hypothetical protein
VKPREFIGQWSITGGWDGKVPDWVKRQAQSLNLHDAASEGKYFLVNGRHFTYDIVPAGQGGSSVSVYRYLRHKAKIN